MRSSGTFPQYEAVLVEDSYELRGGIYEPSSTSSRPSFAYGSAHSSPDVQFVSTVVDKQNRLTF
jgi:hypothetical protein